MFTLNHTRLSRRSVSDVILVAVISWVALGAGALWSAESAHADDMRGSKLVEEHTLDRFAYLKRLSLDLRGTVPLFEEYESLEEHDDVPGSVIDDMLNSDEFVEVMRGYHRDLLWNNVNNIDFIQFPWDLRTVRVRDDENVEHTVYYLNRKSDDYRGGPNDRDGINIPCGGWMQTEYNPDGTPVARLDEETGRRIEGWVWAEPYWAKSHPTLPQQIKVCAFDAQEALTSTTGVDCSSRASSRELSCGCGPNLNFCGTYTGLNVELTIGDQINEQMLKVIDWVIENDRPYHEILTTNRTFVNGPLIHYYNHQSKLASNVNLDPSPIDPIFLPERDFNDMRWIEVVLDDSHSGILTSQAFLLRFQTNRSRVNRFYNSFLNSFFDASQGTDPEDCTKEGANLRERCGCGKCHTNVEPWAAYWGRFKEQGSGYLDPEVFPEYDNECERCATDPTLGCPARCRDNYVIETIPEDHIPYLGQLRSLEFLEPSELNHVAAGPSLWVQRTLYDGSLVRGVVARVWQHFMQRPLTGSAADVAIRDQLVRDFANSQYNIKALVKAIVTHPTYRRIR